MRAVAIIDSGDVRVLSRHGRNWTKAFPELGALASIGPRLVLDGELAVLNPAGQADFGLLGQRLAGEKLAGLHAHNHPATLYAFDVVELEGRDLCSEPWHIRRQVLESLSFSSTAGTGRIMPYTFDGPAMHRLTAEFGYEGTVAKRCSSRYFPGQRTHSWLKIKHRETLWFQILGWRPPTNKSPGGIVVGEYGHPVGVAFLGLGRADREHVLNVFRKYGRTHPTGMLTIPDDAIEAQITFTERTAMGRLREPVCRAVRPYERGSQSA